MLRLVISKQCIILGLRIISCMEPKERDSVEFRWFFFKDLEQCLREALSVSDIQNCFL